MKWVTLWAREYGVHYSELCARFLGDIVKDISPITTNDSAMVPDDGREAYYIPTEDFNRFMGIIIKEYCKDLESFKRLEQRMHRFGRAFVETTERIKAMDLRKKSNGELAALFEEYWMSMLRYNNTIFITFMMSEYTADRAYEIIARKVKDRKKQGKILETVFIPPEKSSIMKLKGEISKGKNPETLYEEYRWMPCVDIIFKPWTKKQFFDAVKGFSKGGREEVKPADFLRGINLSKEEKDALKMGNLGAYIRDRRDEYRRRGFCNIIESLLDEVSKRIGISVNDLGFMLKDEIISALKGEPKPDRSKIEERRKGFVICMKGDRMVCASGKDIPAAIKYLGIEQEKEGISGEIKGITANSGKIQGIVKIVKGANDIKKVGEGEILVAATTHPDYIVAMERAAAFVTDEGGLTSHAAIVAREMDKPCIIGTKIGTKALKDGDRVEVDADKGTVRRLR